MGRQTLVYRRSERKPVRLAARCRKSTGFAGAVLLSDLTPEGCCIATKGMPLKVGQHVTLRPDALEAIGGTIRWVLFNLAGIEFDRPLYGPVVEHLQQKYAPAWQVAAGARPASAPAAKAGDSSLPPLEELPDSRFES